PINMQPLALFLRKEPGGLSSISTANRRWFFAGSLRRAAGCATLFPISLVSAFFRPERFPPFSWNQPEAPLLRQIAWKGFDLIDGFHRIMTLNKYQPAGHRWMGCALPDRCPCSCGPGSGGYKAGQFRCFL